MKSLKHFLSIIQEDEEIETNDKLRCSICGREVTINKEGKGPLICCGEPMSKIASGITTEAGVHPTRAGFFDKCLKKMTGKVSNPEAYCASIKDRSFQSVGWRGKDKTTTQVKKDVKKSKFKLKK